MRAVFESWRGTYSDSPKAISAHLAVARPDVQQVWVADGVSPFPDGLQTVRRNSPQYFFALASATHLVTNDMMPRLPFSRPSLEYVQTWHGTPLKRIGFDTPSGPRGVSETYLTRLRRDVGRWDNLVSPSRFATGAFRSAFQYSGRVLEVGLPRNDVLVGAQAMPTRVRVRRSLGIADTATAVLYAPTWRDDRRGADGSVRADPEASLPEVARIAGDSVVLMQRQHRVVRGWDADEGVLDVSAYPDVQELILAADVLVTDYSSIMFDFAVTGKPIVFYLPDRLNFEQSTRGLYLDLDDIAPGPVVQRSADVAEIVEQPDALRAPFEAAYGDFRRRFCPHDDGGAARRLTEAVFGEPIREGG